LGFECTRGDIEYSNTRITNVELGIDDNEASQTIHDHDLPRNLPHDFPQDLPHDLPRDLLSKGLDFLTALAATLSKPESVKQLTDSLVSKDPADGRTYVKIPVESKEAVQQFIGLIAGMFGSKT